MPFNTRQQLQFSEIIQDNTPTDESLDSEGDQLSATQNRQTLAKLARWVLGLSRLLGDNGKRKGAPKFHGNDVQLTGQIISTGVAVTGAGTQFLSEVNIGDFIKVTGEPFREVQVVVSDTSLTLVEAFPSDIITPASPYRIKTLAERLNIAESISSRNLITLGDDETININDIFPTQANGEYLIFNKSDPKTYIRFYYMIGTPSDAAIRDGSSNLFIDDIDNGINLIQDANNILFKNRLGGVVDFVAHRRA
jgi:hypothetical protein